MVYKKEKENNGKKRELRFNYEKFKKDFDAHCSNVGDVFKDTIKEAKKYDGKPIIRTIVPPFTTSGQSLYMVEENGFAYSISLDWCEEVEK